MRRLGVIGLVLLCLLLIQQPIARADSSVQDVLFNVNGAITQSAFPGIANTSGYNATTGLGTLVLTFNPGAGTYFIDAGFDLSVGNQSVPTVPFWNEYGASGGTLAAGQSWIIGTGASPNDPSTAYQVFNAVAAGGALPGTNSVPGASDNYTQQCSTGASCNNDVASGMGFSFTLGAGEEAVVTLNFSQTAPGSGFYLSQTHPIDPDDNSATTIYFTGSEVNQPVGVVGTPEPGSVLLLGLGLGALSLLKLRK
jgi:hypothetical protein